MSSNEIDRLEDTLDGQRNEELVIIDENGTVRSSPQGANGKVTVLHDPKGEYQRTPDDGGRSS